MKEAGVPGHLTLHEWWQKASFSPPPDEALIGDPELRGVASARGARGQARMLHWFKDNIVDRDTEALCLPVAFPYVVDIASLILGPPRFTSGSPGGHTESAVAGGGLDLDLSFLSDYQNKHLGILANQRAVDFVRRCLRNATREDQDAVIGEFIHEVFRWVQNTWLLADCNGDEKRKQKEAERFSETRYLGREQIPGFLRRLTDVMHEARDFRTVLPEIERFRLGARTLVKTAFEACNYGLIEACLRSRRLDEEEYDVEPVRLAPGLPEVLSSRPGRHIDINRVRTTTELRDLPEVIPQDLGLLRCEPHGRHILTHKLTHDGLLRWERQECIEEVKQETWLVCLVSDSGRQARDNYGGRLHGRRVETTPDTHARRLIFDILHDMAMFVTDPNVRADICVFLKPVSVDGARDPDRGEQGIAWHIPLEELRSGRWGEKFDYMMALETRARGFFFRTRHGGGGDMGPPGPSGLVRPGEDHREFVRRVFGEGRYELALFVFLGLWRTVWYLLPEQPPGRRATNTKDVVIVGQLDWRPDWLKAAVARDFDEVRTAAELDFLSDEQFRHKVLEALLGPRRSRDPGAGDFHLEHCEDWPEDPHTR